MLSKLESMLDSLARMCTRYSMCGPQLSTKCGPFFFTETCCCLSPRDALNVMPSLGGIISGTHSCMLHMLSVAVELGLPLDPLMSSCLQAVAKWQV